MKYIVAVLAGLMTVAIAHSVSANPSDAGNSVLTKNNVVRPTATQHLVSAPLMDASQAQTQIESPIVAAPTPTPEVTTGQVVQPRRTYHRPKKKESFFDKLMDMERKKNAWLKRTFLGM